MIFLATFQSVKERFLIKVVDMNVICDLYGNRFTDADVANVLRISQKDAASLMDNKKTLSDVFTPNVMNLIYVGHITAGDIVRKYGIPKSVVVRRINDGLSFEEIINPVYKLKQRKR